MFQVVGEVDGGHAAAADLRVDRVAAGESRFQAQQQVVQAEQLRQAVARGAHGLPGSGDGVTLTGVDAQDPTSGA